MTDLHRTNINLNAADVEWLQKKYGRGWTEHVREIVHNYIRQENQGSTLRLTNEELDFTEGLDREK